MMSQVIENLIALCETVIAFPFEEYWLDIGQPEQYQQAQNDVRTLNDKGRATMVSTATLLASSGMLDVLHF